MYNLHHLARTVDHMRKTFGQCAKKNAIKVQMHEEEYNQKLL